MGVIEGIFEPVVTIGDAFREDEGGLGVEVLEVCRDAFVEGGVGDVDGGEEVDGGVVELVGAGLEEHAGLVDLDEAGGGFVDHPDAAVGECGQVDDGEKGEVGQGGDDGFRQGEAEVGKVGLGEEEGGAGVLGRGSQAEGEEAQDGGGDFEEPAGIFHGV